MPTKTEQPIAIRPRLGSALARAAQSARADKRSMADTIHQWAEDAEKKESGK